ncbi:MULTISPECIES: FliM/FliN family flagellar motor switch protein [Leptospira]|uniref:FliM/FliN family flagellar motor switch protein n=1 Tax=Leptospira TaxID=171 RepID=UPI001083BC7C|nr:MULTISPECIES: FliM/FliN family flagellar motor switch protein [Leptospira]MCG6146496.1 FliM/FliN family flagellar motor switch protein [Leptospira bandrabouensis]MCG6161868.1 FliM/FliN family flagellar motor switch protein [Leptospira bandrabouensis]MCG6166081.1 FliM/FliN family flagellar motor switch protein [Leptospira bandrabouensis]TGM66135.1 FliM/FliN family flagellar motor switch protein [Leptospira meyeri]
MPNFDDVKLDVSILLGSGKISLSELKLAKKDLVLELETEIIEPVKVLVNGIVKFEGEVVVIGNHFGVKITNEC